MNPLVKKIGYAVYDLLTLYKGAKKSFNGFKVRLPIRWSRYYMEGYEKDTFQYFQENIKPGQTILDIGAHIGLYVGVFGQLTKGKGKVYCFEPTPGTFKILQETIRINNYPNITGINAAVSDKSGFIDLHLATESGEGSNANSIVSIAEGLKKVSVQTYSIDDFRKEYSLKIDVLKIDVEGVELSALRGARETFLLDRPSGVLALHPSSIIQFGHSLEQIWDCLQEYKLKISYEGHEVDRNFFCSKTDFFDVIFSPN